MDSGTDRAYVSDMDVRKVLPAAVTAVVALMFATAAADPSNPAQLRPRAADAVTSTTDLEDDFLNLFTADDTVQDGFADGTDGSGQSVDLPGTGAGSITWSSGALAAAVAGAVVTASARSRRPRRPRNGARSGPAA